MLELDQIDLQDLVEALEDHSDLHTWRLDPGSGAIELSSDDFGDDDGASDLEDRGWIAIEPIESSEGYADLVDFVELVGDPRARDLLERAIEGRGAFRRFKDTLLEFPELRDAWFGFPDVRTERRAIEWLARHAVVAAEAADRAIDDRPDPPPPRWSDPAEIAKAVATELAEIYGERLRDVRLYGSWARGDAHPESDIDLLIVLDRVASRWHERGRVEDVLWRHSFENDVVLSAHPVGEDELERPRSPFLVRVRAEAVPLR
jgi:predicted nucleotidyltransferase